MASSKLRAAAASSSSGDLPADALYEVLLRVPAKDLCRLRAVCRAWRALASCPLFAAAHKSRHTVPLLALAYHDSDAEGVDIMDLSGNVLKRIPSKERDIDLVDKPLNFLVTCIENVIRVLPTHLDLICFTRDFHPLGLWVINPATGATLALPECLSEKLARELLSEYSIKVESRAFGKVSATGEYKALRITRIGGEYGQQLCEVITLDGTNLGRWREKKGPPSPICTSREMRCVVIDGVVHFLIDFSTCSFNGGGGAR